tara:strand:- start:142 stop:390 length:249 start_codon:yes stop_codon:yes gene_type:complete
MFLNKDVSCGTGALSAVTAANGGNPKNTLVASGVDVNSVNIKGIAAALALAKEADVVSEYLSQPFHGQKFKLYSTDYRIIIV